MLSIMLLSLVSCNQSGFDAVSIRPIYGWVDGCNTVSVTGRGFGDDISVTIGDQPLGNLQLPPKEDTIQSNYGYLVTGVMPASLNGKGYADVTVTTGGKTDVITGSGAYYYVECPQPGYIETVSPADGVAAGTEITLTGCSIDTANMMVQLVDSTLEPVGSSQALTTVCGTAQVKFTAPAVPTDGTYFVEIVDLSGNVLSGAPCPPPDSADTASSCSDFPIVYGSAQ